ncbi:hypothetical protein ACTZWW_22515 [Salinarimonas sp. NSM]|uniref:hypothetical protein n=1 Tax=Salinarimonas sp. NSM TaxID=3458003 RepID=UPI00403648C1
MNRPRNRLAVLPGPLPAAPFAVRDARRSAGPQRLLRLAAAVALAGLTMLVLRAATPDASASVAPAGTPTAAQGTPGPQACDPRPWRQRSALCSQALPGGEPRVVRVVALAPTTQAP